MRFKPQCVGVIAVGLARVLKCLFIQSTPLTMVFSKTALFVIGLAMKLVAHVIMLAVTAVVVCATSCDRTSQRPAAATPTLEVSNSVQNSLAVRCQRLDLDADSFEDVSFSLSQSLGAHRYVLTDIETFFLFQLRTGLNEKFSPFHRTPPT